MALKGTKKLLSSKKLEPILKELFELESIIQDAFESTTTGFIFDDDDLISLRSHIEKYDSINRRMGFEKSRYPYFAKEYTDLFGEYYPLV